MRLYYDTRRYETRILKPRYVARMAYPNGNKPMLHTPTVYTLHCPGLCRQIAYKDILRSLTLYKSPWMKWFGKLSNRYAYSIFISNGLNAGYTFVNDSLIWLNIDRTGFQDIARYSQAFWKEQCNNWVTLALWTQIRPRRLSYLTKLSLCHGIEANALKVRCSCGNGVHSDT